MGVVYLIHLEKKMAHAQHYLGYADDLFARLEKHEAGNGSRFMQVVAERGIPWFLARTWRGVDRSFERKLKNQHHGPRLCPTCQSLARHRQEHQ